MNPTRLEREKGTEDTTVAGAGGRTAHLQIDGVEKCNGIDVQGTLQRDTTSLVCLIHLFVILIGRMECGVLPARFSVALVGAEIITTTSYA